MLAIGRLTGPSACAAPGRMQTGCDSCISPAGFERTSPVADFSWLASCCEPHGTICCCCSSCCCSCCCCWCCCSGCCRCCFLALWTSASHPLQLLVPGAVATQQAAPDQFPEPISLLPTLSLTAQDYVLGPQQLSVQLQEWPFMCPVCRILLAAIHPVCM